MIWENSTISVFFVQVVINWVIYPKVYVLVLSKVLMLGIYLILSYLICLFIQFKNNILFYFYSKNELLKLPFSICCISTLKDLYASWNSISEIDSDLHLLTNLNSLDLSLNKITYFPDVVFPNLNRVLFSFFLSFFNNYNLYIY